MPPGIHPQYKLTKAKIEEGNNFINSFDPAKDASIHFTVDEGRVGLTNDVHGNFLIGLYRQLYHLDTIDIAPVGVGDTKARILKKLVTLFGDQPVHQQFTSLRFGGPVDMRLSNLNIAIDTGYILDTIGDETCHTVVNPASVIDPGSRSLHTPGQVNLLTRERTFDFTAQGFHGILHMNKFIQSIKYKHIPHGHNGPYEFTVSFTVPKGPLKFTYNIQRKSFEPLIMNSTNEIRNHGIYSLFQTYDFMAGLNAADYKVILDNLYNHTDDELIELFEQKSELSGKDLEDMMNECMEWIQEILFEVFWKELCDTLLVTALLEDISTPGTGLRPENTAIATIDKVVLFRSILNGVACLYTNSGICQFYPILDGIYRKNLVPHVPDLNPPVQVIKRKMFRRLNQHNQEVRQILIKCLEHTQFPDFAIKQFSGVDFTDPRHRLGPEDIQAKRAAIFTIFRNLFQSMIAYVVPCIEAINTFLSPLVDDESGLEDFQRHIAIYTLNIPSRPSRTTKHVKLTLGFRQFLDAPLTVPAQLNGRPIDGTEQFDFYRGAELLYRTTEHLPTGRELAPIFGTGPRRLPFTFDGNIEIPTKGKKRPREQGGGARTTEEETHMLKEMLQKNKDLPNFLLYFITLYAPELLYMAYAYFLTIDPKNHGLKVYIHVTTHSVREKLFEPFGRATRDGIEYTPPEDPKNFDTLCIHAIGLLNSALDVPHKGDTMFDLCKEHATTVMWLLEHAHHYYKIPSVAIKEDPLLHTTALGYYEDIYAVDVKLCTLNKRTETSPLALIKPYSFDVEAHADKGPKASLTNLIILLNELTEDLQPRASKSAVKTPNRGKASLSVSPRSLSPPSKKQRPSSTHPLAINLNNTGGSGKRRTKRSSSIKKRLSHKTRKLSSHRKRGSLRA
jgi:hypothetical protein